MLLNEFIYFDKDHAEPTDNDRYNIANDKNVLKSNDLRKTERLTLSVLRDLRKASEAREKEKQEDLSLVRVMYRMPTEEAAGGLT